MAWKDIALHCDRSAPLIGAVVRQPSSRERVRDGRERVVTLGHLLHERVVLASELLVVAADLADDAVRASTVWALRLVLAETAAGSAVPSQRQDQPQEGAVARTDR